MGPGGTLQDSKIYCHDFFDINMCVWYLRSVYIPVKIKPIPIIDPSNCWFTTVRKIWSYCLLFLSNSMDRLLKAAMKDCHHEISARISSLSLTLWLSALSAFNVSMVRREYTLPPQTTLAEKLSFPARDWSCFLKVRVRFWNRSSSSLTWWSFLSGRRRVMLTESISMPKKIILVVGSTTLFQLIWKPSLQRNCTSIWSATAQSFKVSALLKKSSKLTTVALSPRLFNIRFTACVRRWKMPGLVLIRKEAVYPWRIQFANQTAT